MNFPEFKKEISMFLNSEEAKVLKGNIAKIGLTASVIASIMTQMANAEIGHTDHDDTTHSDSHGDSPPQHSDGWSVHSDSHVNDFDPYHADGGHHDNSMAFHMSTPEYDSVNERGGHASQMNHSSY